MGEGQRIPSRLHAVSAEPDAGPKPTNQEIMTRAGIKRRVLNLLSHPGAPLPRHRPLFCDCNGRNPCSS